MRHSSAQIMALDETETNAEQPHENISATGRRSRRGTFLKWLRQVHGWIGLWGAVLGLLFGTTGVLLNHRAVMKIPVTEAHESMLHLPLPDPVPANAQAMADWLQQTLSLDRPAARVKSDSSKPVAWGDKTVRQPEHWSAMFSSPRFNLQAEYWVGNRFVDVKRSDNSFFAKLTNLHKGVGMSVGWILLVDTLAGSIILLSLTGVLLWALMNRRRMIGAAIGFTSLALVGGFALQALS